VDLTPGHWESPRFDLSERDGYAIAPDGKEIVYVSNHDKESQSSTNGDLWVATRAYERTKKMVIGWGMQPIEGEAPVLESLTLNRFLSKNTRLNMIAIQGDARALPIKSNSVNLIITSPPYWQGDTYDNHRGIDPRAGQHTFDTHLLAALEEMIRVLAPDAKLCINIGDVFFGPEKPKNRTDNAVRLFSQLRESPKMQFYGRIMWVKGKDIETAGIRRGKRIYGSYPFPTNIRCDGSLEEIFLWRKRGKRKIHRMIKQHSRFDKEFIRSFTNPVWCIPARTLQNHPAAFPEEMPARLIRAFSFARVSLSTLFGDFAGDIILDPFAGSGTTARVAERLGRRGLAVDISLAYLKASC